MQVSTASRKQPATNLFIVDTMFHLVNAVEAATFWGQLGKHSIIVNNVGQTSDG